MKSGILLVIALLALMQVVDAAASTSGFGFSSVASNPQYYSPGRYSGYSQQYADIYWPQISNPDKCEASSDFIMAVRPGGCSPAVVRSDLLAEQNVPVFCMVDVMKINPLIDVNKIKSVRFKGESNPNVVGVSFHPNREAIYSQQGYLHNPFINDVGYVVVLLKRQEVEDNLPGSVKLNLTGVIRYDAEGFFGAGQQNYYLDPDLDWEIGDYYKENSFFKGKGYLRAEWIEGNKVGVGVYTDQDTRLRLLELEKGETSNIVYMPGFYCKAGVRVKLVDLQANVEKAKLEVDGDDVWLMEGEEFLDGLCKVVSINLDTTATIESASVKVYCSGKSYTLSYSNDLANAEEERECENKPVTEEIMKNYEQAKAYARDVQGIYGVAADPDSGNVWAAQALFQLGELADDIGLDKDAMEIYQEVLDTYPGTDYAERILSRDMIKAVCNPTTSYDEHFIKLKKIELPDRSEASANFSVWKNEDLIWDVKDKEGVITNELFANNRFKVTKLTAEKVDLIYFKKDNKNRVAFSLTPSEDSKTFEDTGESYTIKLEDINLRQIAKVTLISEMPNEYSEANFIVEIGIEKRAIQLSPGKTREMIENLNQSIEKWEGIVDNLGKVVEGMKGVCFATSTILLMKNFMANLGGRATARQEVMPAYISHCSQKFGADTPEFNKCLVDLSAEIEQAIDVKEAAISSTNDEMLDIQNKLEASDGSISRNKLADELRGKWFSEGTATMDNYVLNKDTGIVEKRAGITITNEELNAANPTQLRELNANQITLQNPKATDILKSEASTNIKSIKSSLTTKASRERTGEGGGLYYTDRESVVDTPETTTLPAAPSAVINANTVSTGLQVPEKTLLSAVAVSGSDDDMNWVKNVKIQYHPCKLAYRVPVPEVYTSTEGKKVSGYYIIIEENEYSGGCSGSGQPRSFTIFNVGNDGLPDIAGDESFGYFDTQGIAQTCTERGASVLGVSGKECEQLIIDAKSALKVVNTNYGRNNFNLLGTMVNVDLAGKGGGTSCYNFMSPKDCYILFNVCDPVICPSSRCDLGGTYRVDNVIQSGIIGSIALCLPNVKEGIMIPVCLSGIHAGLENYLSILKSHRDCLQESLDTGKQVGICDEIYSIYLCEFFWRQLAPFLDNLIPNLIQAAYGQGMKGGGEYLTVMDAWQNLEGTVEFMRDDYAINSFKAFNARSTDEIGGQICKMFVSSRYPSSKSFFENLLEPDSPVQYHAWFDEIPFSDATMPPTSQYKVFFHIYAGKDEGIYYQVYLKSPPEYAYVGVTETIVVDTGYIPKGSYASKTEDFTAPAGYQELCVRVNGQDECGFGKVGTSFAMDVVSDAYYQGQAAEMDVQGSDECVSGSRSALSVLQTPNIQEGFDDAVNPQLDTKGVVRVCATMSPGQGVDPYIGNPQRQRWKEVGVCDDENVKCWLDTQSVKDVIKNKNISASVVQSGGKVTEKIDAVELYPSDQIEKILEDANQLALKIDKENKYDPQKVDAMVTMLEDVEAHSYNFMGARAVFLKFRIYESITKVLNRGMQDAGTPEKLPDSLVSGASVVNVLEYQDGRWNSNLFYKFDNKWMWSPDKVNWMETNELQIRGGNYDGATPVQGNQNLIQALDKVSSSCENGAGFFMQKLLTDRTIVNPAISVSRSGNEIKKYPQSEITDAFNSVDKTVYNQEVAELTGYLCGGSESGGEVEGSESRSISDMVRYAQANSVRNSANEPKTCKEDYSMWIEQYAAEENINPVLLLALMIQESDCQQAKESNAEGDKKSFGVIQINKETYDDLCNGVGSGFEDIKTSAEKNIQCGVKILSKRYDLYKDGVTRSSVYSSNSDFKKLVDDCIESYPKYSTYTGWNAALRGYNGWGCGGNADLDYVEKINSINSVLESVNLT
ncbi:MAG: transglycosylase SLT domain-containing protein [archaeon]